MYVPNFQTSENQPLYNKGGVRVRTPPVFFGQMIVSSFLYGILYNSRVWDTGDYLSALYTSLRRWRRLSLSFSTSVSNERICVRKDVDLLIANLRRISANFDTF